MAPFSWFQSLQTQREKKLIRSLKMYLHEGQSIDNKCQSLQMNMTIMKIKPITILAMLVIEKMYTVLIPSSIHSDLSWNFQENAIGTCKAKFHNLCQNPPYLYQNRIFGTTYGQPSKHKGYRNFVTCCNCSCPCRHVCKVWKHRQGTSRLFDRLTLYLGHREIGERQGNRGLELLGSRV